MTGSLHRRDALRALAAAALAGAAGPALAVAPTSRKMTIDLVCGNIGVKADQPQAIAFAAEHRFESVQPDAAYLAGLDGAKLRDLLATLEAKGLVWGAAGLSVDFRGDEATFARGMKDLPAQAKGLQAAGATRVGTWLRPAHPELTYLANLKQHATRLREIAKVLGDHGLRFGLEYVGPKTSWTAARYPFVHTMAEARELIAEIDRDNVGLVLDSWHWYTAGETVQDILALTNREVVACDLNDAPAAIPVDRQMDLVRELPCATGVINLKAFLECLVLIGYDGPVRAEPFNAALRMLPPAEALAATSRAMHQALALLG